MALTLDIYSHVLPQADQEAADRIAALDRALVEEVAQALRLAVALQLGHRLGLDLADALAGEAELLADLLQRARLPVLEAEAQLDDLALALASAGRATWLSSSLCMISLTASSGTMASSSSMKSPSCESPSSPTGLSRLTGLLAAS